MGYNDTNRNPKIDEVAYVPATGRTGAEMLKGKIVGIAHDDQTVLVKTENIPAKLIKAPTVSIMFGEDPEREPEARVD